MAKKEDIDKKKAGTVEAGTQESETPADNNQGPNTAVTAVIETVEDLEACYPVLVSKIKDQVIEKIRMSPVEKVKENLPELYQRIAMDIQGKSGPNLNVPGFLLEVDDPFAQGTLRTYQNLKGISGLRLPYILPYKDEKTKVTLENYILRANGGGDIKRTEAARKAMERCK